MISFVRPTAQITKWICGHILFNYSEQLNLTFIMCNCNDQWECLNREKLCKALTDVETKLQFILSGLPLGRISYSPITVPLALLLIFCYCNCNHSISVTACFNSQSEHTSFRKQENDYKQIRCNGVRFTFEMERNSCYVRYIRQFSIMSPAWNVRVIHFLLCCVEQGS